LTSYERRALYRFVTLYLGSVFALLAVIGYLFFENNVSMMKSAVKFEMMDQARKLSSQIIFKAMSGEQIQPEVYLGGLNRSRFEVGYYDAKKRAFYTQIPDFADFDLSFSIKGGSYYTVLEEPSGHLGVHYIILKEGRLTLEMGALRIKMIRYLILSFILMGFVGYFLGRLFLAPVHEKIESLDRFIDDTTHELNTPITAILMTIESLKGCDAKKLKRLEVSSKRLSLTYDSLTYRLRENNKESFRERFSFTQLLMERLGYFKELIEAKKLTIETHVDELTVLMDKESAIRLIDNLLSNAIKYNNLDGSITLSIEDGRLIISDDGIGIDPSVQKEIFKRYRRADKDRGGFGIGLDIVLSVCKQYDIGIDVESERGKGSRFTLNFRRVKA